jgi:hypothetical protein
MHFEESKRLVNSSVLFPLTPALSLGERENRIQSFPEIRALDLRGGTPELQPSGGGCSLPQGEGKGASAFNRPHEVFC